MLHLIMSHSTYCSRASASLIDCFCTTHTSKWNCRVARKKKRATTTIRHDYANCQTKIWFKLWTAREIALSSCCKSKCFVRWFGFFLRGSVSVCVNHSILIMFIALWHLLLLTCDGMRFKNHQTWTFVVKKNVVVFLFCSQIVRNHLAVNSSEGSAKNFCTPKWKEWFFEGDDSFGINHVQ